MTRTRFLRWFSAAAAALLLSVFVAPVALSGPAGAVLDAHRPRKAWRRRPRLARVREQLNLIAWEGYAQPQWVKPFEKTTGAWST